MPPVIDAPRRARVRDVQALSEAEALVFFEGVEDLTVAEMLAGRRVLVREEAVDLAVLEEAEALPDWSGWSVEDVRAGYVGEVASVDERATQPLLAVARPDGRETLVPLVDAFIAAVDEERRLIRLTCPDGLLDL